MKFTYFKKQVINFINGNKLIFILLLFCLVAGIATGSIFSVTASSQTFNETSEYINSFVSAYSLQMVDGAGIVKYSLMGNGKTLINLFLCGICRWFVPVPFFEAIFSGFEFGFTTTTIVRLFGIRGIPFVFVSSLPQMFVFIPAFVFYCVYNVNHTLSVRNTSVQNIRGRLVNIFCVKNLLYIFALILVALITALIDGYVIPVVLKPLCAILCK